MFFSLRRFIQLSPPHILLHNQPIFLRTSVTYLGFKMDVKLDIYVYKDGLLISVTLRALSNVGLIN